MSVMFPFLNGTDGMLAAEVWAATFIGSEFQML
jgi:hypothetical protein